MPYKEKKRGGVLYALTLHLLWLFLPRCTHISTSCPCVRLALLIPNALWSDFHFPDVETELESNILLRVT